MLRADGDDLDFHQSIFRQTCYFDAGAGRAILFEIFGVGRVHRAKVIHVLDEDGGFDDIVQRAAGSCQNRLDILQRLAGDLLGHRPTLGVIGLQELPAGLPRWGDAQAAYSKPLHGYKTTLKKDENGQIQIDKVTEIEIWAARNFNPSVNHVMPIPINEIAKSNNLVQNKGY